MTPTGAETDLGKVVLAPAVDQAIRAHARDTYPDECCGALVGTGTRVAHTVPLPNTTEEGPRRRFLVRPADYRLAEDAARRLGGALLGFYHSHPEAPARPSQYDLDHAWPVFFYVIVAVAQGEPGPMTCWLLQPDRSKFLERPLGSNAG
jgi:proteasome lid subunit RPN8/RPN11